VVGLQVSAFNESNVNRVSESIEMVVIIVWHHIVLLLAVKVGMVLMTFDRVLWGMS